MKVKANLTKREKQVLELILESRTNDEIAKELDRSKRTIEKHRRNILIKTGSKNTVGLVLYAVKWGLIKVSIIPNQI